MSDIGDDWRDPGHIPLDDLSDPPVPVLSAEADPLRSPAAAGAAPGAAAASPGEGERDDGADTDPNSGTGWV